MLILTREIDEDILIGDDILVTVVGIRGDKVRIGIEAPPHVSIDRREVRERKPRDGEHKCPSWRRLDKRLKHEKARDT